MKQVTGDASFENSSLTIYGDGPLVINVDAATAEKAVAYIVDKLEEDGLLEGMQS